MSDLVFLSSSYRLFCSLPNPSISYCSGFVLLTYYFLPFLRLTFLTAYFSYFSLLTFYFSHFLLPTPRISYFSFVVLLTSFFSDVLLFLLVLTSRFVLLTRMASCVLRFLVLTSHWQCFLPLTSFFSYFRAACFFLLTSYDAYVWLCIVLTFYVLLLTCRTSYFLCFLPLTGLTSHFSYFLLLYYCPLLIGFLFFTSYDSHFLLLTAYL